MQARFQLDQARVALELATLKAENPEGMIGASTCREPVGFKQTTNALENAQRGYDDKSKLLAERTEGAGWDFPDKPGAGKMAAQTLDSFTVHGKPVPSFVIYDNHPWTRASSRKATTSRPAS